MSKKWINKELFNSFKQEKKEEKEEVKTSFDSNNVWPNPKPGSTYSGRLLPSKDGEFYTRYVYHWFQISDDEFFRMLCPKSYNPKSFCPLCSATNALYKKGDRESKALAYQLKKKERYLANFFVRKDPRDASIEDEEKKSEGKVKLYHFPSKVASKVKREITSDDGYQEEIFSPGSDGRDLILEVTTTKKDSDGRSFPSYDNTSFSRKQSAIAKSDKAIQAIMDSTHSLKEHLQQMEKTPKEVIEMMKDNFLYEFAEEQIKKHGYGVTVSTSVKEVKTVNDERLLKESDLKDSSEIKAESANIDDMSDSDLLQELDDM